MNQKQSFHMKQKLTKVVTTGTHLRADSPIVQTFGCARCTWIGTTHCPHGLLRGSTHANKICSHRVLYLQEQIEKCGTATKLVQQEELLKLTQISGCLLQDYGETGMLPDEFKHISKLIVSLTDKMRKQDEGIKFQGEISVTHDKFKDLVEIEAKKIEERNNRSRPAEFSEEI